MSNKNLCPNLTYLPLITLRYAQTTRLWSTVKLGRCIANNQIPAHLINLTGRKHLEMTPRSMIRLLRSWIKLATVRWRTAHLTRVWWVTSLRRLASTLTPTCLPKMWETRRGILIWNWRQKRGRRATRRQISATSLHKSGPSWTTAQFHFRKILSLRNRNCSWRTTLTRWFSRKFISCKTWSLKFRSQTPKFTR